MPPIFRIIPPILPLYLKRLDGLHSTRSFTTHDLPTRWPEAAIEAFLSHLAVQQKVAASIQHQALSALLFRYRDVLKTPLDHPIDAMRAKQPRLNMDSRELGG